MREIKDYYYRKAKKEGFVARSAFKLIEINDKHNIIAPGYSVLDLGCFPGSWTQYISQKVGARGLVVGVDRTQMTLPLGENTRFIHSDIDHLDVGNPDLFPGKFDVVCSDMAPNTSGIKDVDSERSLGLCQTALYIAQRVLRSRGTSLVKVFQGVAFERLRTQMREEYHQIKVIKPKSSRSESREVFLLGLGKH